MLSGQSPMSQFRVGSFLQSPTPANRFPSSPNVVRQIFTTPAAPSDSSESNASQTPTKKNSSLHLFFRKVYNLALIRLDAMCRYFELQEDVLDPAWTCLEWVLMQQVMVMKDRHLDQVIMCTLYLMCKVRKQEKTFAAILEYYRKYQPQADSTVYRSVLLTTSEHNKEAPTDTNKDNTEDRKTEPPPTPSRQQFSTSVSQDGKVRGDLINFFNSVFLELPGLKEFALKFSITKENQPPLSPRPRLRATNMSPR